MAKVAIIGQGYVGLTIAAFASKSNQVTGFDSNHKVVDQLNQGISHIEGVDSALLKSAISTGNYKASTNGADIADAEIVVLEKSGHVSYANCGLPYFVGGVIEEEDALLLQTPASLHARFKLDVRVATEVDRKSVV